MVRNTGIDPYRDLQKDDWWYPDRLPADDPLVLSEDQVSRFVHDGFVVVTNLWPERLVDAAAREAMALHPSHDLLQKNSGAGGFSAMPWTQQRESSPDSVLNHMTIHPRALAAVAQLMGVSEMDLRLSQSHVIAKVGYRIEDPAHPEYGQITGDQDIHVDYGNNTLMVPPHNGPAEAVACLCYYSDVEEAGGATHFARAAPGELTSYEPTRFNPPNFVIGTQNGSAAEQTGPRTAERTEARYREEKPVYYKPGTCILYRLNAWHRGTPAALNAVRHTHHHVWRHRNAEWVNWQSLAPRMSAMPTRYMASLSVVQRSVLGFAAPGDPYWTVETVDSVGQRYPEMDMSPYRQGLS